MYGNYFLRGDMEAVEFFSEDFLVKNFYIWHVEAGFGSTSWNNIFYSIIYLFQHSAQRLFGPILAQTIFYSLLFSVPVIPFNNLLKNIGVEKKDSVILSIIFFTSFLYATNNALMLPFMILRIIPVFIIANKIFVIEKSFNYEDVICIVLIFISGRNQADFLSITIFFLAVMIYKIIININDEIVRKNYIKKFCFIVCFFAIVGLPYYYVNIYEVITKISQYTSDPWNVGMRDGLRTYWLNNGFRNFVRGFNQEFFLIWNEERNFSYSSVYENSYYQLISFIPEVFLLFGYLKKIKILKKPEKIIFLIFFISLLLFSILAEPTGTIARLLTETPILSFMFRNPTNRFFVFYISFLITAIAILLKNIKKAFYKNFMLVLMLFLYSFPVLLTGNLVNKRYEFDGSKIRIYQEACEKINNDSDIVSIVILPFYNTLLIRTEDGHEGYDIFNQCLLKSYWSPSSNYNSDFNRYLYNEMISDLSFSLESIIEMGINTFIIYDYDYIKSEIISMDETSYTTFVNTLINKPNSDVIYEADFFKVIKLMDINPYKSMDDIQTEQISPVKYSFITRLNAEKKTVVLRQTYDKDWKMFLRSHHNKSKKNRNIEIIDDLSYLWRKPIFEETHELVYDYANGWTIDPEYIKANYPPEYYHENPDGSIDIQLTLYFKPQSYFYLGIIISATTFTGCVIYLIIDTVKNRRKKKNNEINNLILDNN